jgi:hypothetical protein
MGHSKQEPNMAANRKPDLILKHDVRNTDGKTIRSVRIGAAWLPEENRPGRIKIEYIPVGWDGAVTVWPFSDPMED